MFKKSKSNYELERRSRLKESLNMSDDLDIDVPIYTVKKEKDSYTMYIIYGVFMSTLFILWSLFGFAKVDGHSMDPTLHPGQRIVYSKTEPVNRFDIVILKERLQDDDAGKFIVKRVIGMPGDVVTVINGELYINDKKVDEDYLSQNLIKEFKKTSWTIKVPQGRYFVLGDNRDVSKDSRHVGNFKKSAVVGVAIVKD